LLNEPGVILRSRTAQPVIEVGGVHRPPRRIPELRHEMEEHHRVRSARHPDHHPLAGTDRPHPLERPPYPIE
jgi:hypothetical protein